MAHEVPSTPTAPTGATTSINGADQRIYLVAPHETRAEDSRYLSILSNVFGGHPETNELINQAKGSGNKLAELLLTLAGLSHVHRTRNILIRFTLKFPHRPADPLGLQ